MSNASNTIGIEINPNLIGAMFTERIGNTLRFFCFYTNSQISQFDVEADQNKEPLNSLFSKLKMEETCTSLILDEVVQGRLFVQAKGQLFVYTFLKAFGETLPPLNADLAAYDWNVIWRAQETEILECVDDRAGRGCYAIRTQISQNDAAQLMMASKAFSSPISKPRTKKFNWRSLVTGTLLALLALFIGCTIYFASRQTSQLVPPAAGTVVATAPEGGLNYFLLCNHKISGPFPAKVVSAMNASGLLPADALYRPENASDWLKISDLKAP